MTTTLTATQILLDADSVRAKAREALAAINDNTRLTPEARAADIATVKETAVARLRSLRQQYEAAVEGDRRRLELAAYGPPPGGPSDALGRAQWSQLWSASRSEAATVRGDQLDGAFRAAARSGDELLARAIALRAIVAGKHDLPEISAYVTDHPELRTAFTSYAAHLAGESSLDVKMATNIAFSSGEFR